jgi:choline dehydrogenase-like flavoprotein
MAVEDFINKRYDYIVCGGGTAGLVVAARLTENPDITVGVLEAGGSGLDDVLIDAPNLFLQLYGKPQYDWDYKTVPQVRCHSFDSSKTLLTSLLERNWRSYSWLGSRKGPWWQLRYQLYVCASST